MNSLLTNISTSFRCKSSSYTEILHLDDGQRQALAFVIAFIIVLGFLSNTAAVYFILRLKLQKKSYSMKLILFLFTLDLGVCFIAMPLHLTALIVDHTCGVIFTVEFCAQTFGHLSAYTTGIIGYDRYLRMRHLNSYSTIVKPWRIVTAVSITAFLSVAHGAAYATGVLENWYTTASTVGSIIDCFVFSFMILPYVLLLRVIRRYRRASTHQQMLDNVDHSINRIAFRIVIAVVLLYTPYVMITIIRQTPALTKHMKKHQTFCITLLMCYHFLYANSFVNSLIFISVNSACREQFKRMCGMNWRPGRENERTATTVCNDIGLTDIKTLCKRTGH